MRLILVTRIVFALASLADLSIAQDKQATQGSKQQVGFEDPTFFREITVGTQSFLTPREVKVLPMFFVPKGESAPTAALVARLTRHLKLVQDRYAELLPGQITFAIAEKTPPLYWAAKPMEYYKNQPEDAAPAIVGELLTDLNCNRYNCPYILLVVVMNPKAEFPNPGGRSINGGFNTGGGIIVCSSLTLDKNVWFQSTLQHEIGHSFGLPHVDAYGYDMKTNDSLMSYNPNHHTNQFTLSRTPGKLIPEDRRGLSLNTRVFPGLKFDPAQDIPHGYNIAERIATLGPMTIPGQPGGVKVTTKSGEDYFSKVTNIVQNEIQPNKKSTRITYNPKTMWHSAPTTTGRVSIEVTFPGEVELDCLQVHSQHSGQFHLAEALKIAAGDASGQFTPVIESELKSPDDQVTFPRTKATTWQFEFRAGESRMVVLRGLRFFLGEDELFPPPVSKYP